MKPSRDVVAGVVEASCTCCAEARALIHHIQLGPTRMVCPESGRTFLDRGDGLFQADGQILALDQVGPSATRGPGEAASGPGAAARGPGARGPGETARGPGARGPGEAAPGARGPGEASDLLSDRPARTADKTRISLERATFASGAGA